MPRDVTVEEPGTWIVCFEGYDEPAETRKHCAVSAQRVVGLETCCVDCWVEGSWGAGREVREW
tara:strand:- start:1189 stop:1377 length:189 start_codon:yes stop_codon:yes gene_type:complete